MHLRTANAQDVNIACHKCTVGYGDKIYRWLITKQGAIDTSQNKFGGGQSDQQCMESEV
ncbi:hypothetical protein [Yoonia sp.]|uniref:hypothetical protein n=1 Tax=Yoonia sp. TaxID=2212373 RepID=UPI0019D9ED63|nr:hypothetical protein [Yoonia sp.]